MTMSVPKAIEATESEGWAVWRGRLLMLAAVLVVALSATP